MALTLLNREIKKVHVIDDDEDSRDSYGLTVEEIDVETILQKERVESIENFLFKMTSADAIVSDHHLKKTSSYFPTNGAEFVSRCYDKGIPSVLVTKYEMASYHEIRPYKNKIPIVLTPEQFNPESLTSGLAECINEFRGNLSPSRRTWRTLIRFDDVVEKSVMAIIPSWNRNMVINLKLMELPPEIQEIAKPETRVFANVNLEAEDPYELYFTNWESIEK